MDFQKLWKQHKMGSPLLRLGAAVGGRGGSGGVESGWVTDLVREALQSDAEKRNPLHPKLKWL